MYIPNLYERRRGRLQAPSYPDPNDQEIRLFWATLVMERRLPSTRKRALTSTPRARRLISQSASLPRNSGLPRRAETRPTNRTIANRRTVTRPTGKQAREHTGILPQRPLQQRSYPPNMPRAQTSKDPLRGDLPRRPNLQQRYRNRLLLLVNAERRAHNVPPVVLNNGLSQVARAHNADLAFQQMRLSHVGTDGAKLSQRLLRGGVSFRYASENVARGQGTPSHVVNSWMKSPGHRKNLLNGRAKEMGVHVGRGRDGRLYWAQLFKSDK